MSHNYLGRKRLGDLLNLKRGYDLPENKRKPGPYPVISSSGVTGYHDSFKVDGQGVVTGRYGTLGEMYYTDGRYWPHNTALYVTDFKGNVPKYIYYLLSCIGRIRTSEKSAVPGVNRNELHEMIVPVIESNDKQRDIAEILTTIDEKIVVNNQIISNLSSLARTLYEYWFIQFDFPDCDGNTYRSFEGKMVYNRLLRREIPDGWRAGNVLNVAELLGGGTPAKSNKCYWVGDIPFFTPADASDVPYQLQTYAYINENAVRNSSTKVFNRNTIFITARGSVGKLVLNSVPMAMNQSCYALRAFDGWSYSYLYFLVMDLIRYLKVKASGSVFNSIVSNDIKQTYLPIPEDNEIVKKFATVVEPQFEVIEKKTTENYLLCELRDWLLPMLMNGQVLVSD